MIFYTFANVKRKDMLNNTLIIIAIGLILLLLFNVYLRVVVFKAYKTLLENKIDFTPKQMMNSQLLEKEVIPKYPEHAAAIRQFSRKVNISIYVGILMLIIILFLGYTLVRNR